MNLYFTFYLDFVIRYREATVQNVSLMVYFKKYVMVFFRYHVFLVYLGQKWSKIWFKSRAINLIEPFSYIFLQLLKCDISIWRVSVAFPHKTVMSLLTNIHQYFCLPSPLPTKTFGNLSLFLAKPWSQWKTCQSSPSPAFFFLKFKF